MNVTTAVLMEPTEEAVEVRDMFQPGPSEADLYRLLSLIEVASTKASTTK